VADVLKSGLRESDVICRYGGEEFGILLTHTDLDDAAEMAERLRSAVEEADCDGVSLAVSIGVSSVCLGPGEPDALVDQADRALYVAKRRGRNRVVRFDEVGEEAAEGASQKSAITPDEGDSLDTPIPWPAVNSLMAALGHRDMDTVAHDRRVADWCLATARGLMSAHECYVLEVAAMLHDIGKIGVPDAILLKPGPLNEDEWKVMREHDIMGLDIVSAAFASPELTTTIRNCHCWYGGSSHDPSLPKGEDIPLSARILTIADAFDAMTTARTYRRAKSQEEAFAELRRCSGTQFDPDMVERFVEVVSARKGTAPTISERTAGQVGHLVDCLVAALEKRDDAAIASVAVELKDAAAREGLTDLASAARQLEESATAGQESERVVELATRLVDRAGLALRSRSADSAVPETLTLISQARR
jgi:HD-GYP domain-containing protein (c-di-GMP phosphodiesterase class II)/HPt (histidine-containing phosphotransfer) domain-containing protein